MVILTESTRSAPAGGRDRDTADRRGTALPGEALQLAEVMRCAGRVLAPEEWNTLATRAAPLPTVVCSETVAGGSLCVASTPRGHVGDVLHDGVDEVAASLGDFPK